jgi:hypothetical protein
VAKTKSTTSTNSSSPSSAKRKSAASKRPSESPDKKTTGGQRAISQAEIGHVAGEIWGLLSTNGGQSLATIKKTVNAPSEIVLAAIGWLAREDKLEFTTSGRTVKISLR